MGTVGAGRGSGLCGASAQGSGTFSQERPEPFGSRLRFVAPVDHDGSEPSASWHPHPVNGHAAARASAKEQASIAAELRIGAEQARARAAAHRARAAKLLSDEDQPPASVTASPTSATLPLRIRAETRSGGPWQKLDHTRA